MAAWGWGLGVGVGLGWGGWGLKWCRSACCPPQRPACRGRNWVRDRVAVGVGQHVGVGQQAGGDRLNRRLAKLKRQPSAVVRPHATAGCRACAEAEARLDKALLAQGGVWQKGSSAGRLPGLYAQTRGGGVQFSGPPRLHLRVFYCVLWAASAMSRPNSAMLGWG